MTQPFPIVEKAIKQYIESAYPVALGKTGGDPSFDSGADLYVWISLVPGGGRTDEIYGQWTYDIDVFAPDYVTAMGHALNLEALLVGPRHVTPTLILDNTYQNEAPSERPWDDETMVRIGATYVSTARRPGVVLR